MGDDACEASVNSMDSNMPSENVLKGDDINLVFELLALM
jgi:hypothetical protein